MNVREPVSDARLVRMLVRRAARGHPGDLQASIWAEMDTIVPRRSWWPLGRHLPTRSFQPLPMVVAAGLLLLALLAVALVAGAVWLQRHQSPPIELRPTGIETLTAGDMTWAEVVEDGTGTLWAVGSEEVTRFDPASGEHHTWTVGDDATFAAGPATPARAGGVWIWSDDWILRFAGDGFEDAIPAPGPPGAFDEAPDGSLWASSGATDLARWDGDRWVAARPLDVPAGHEVNRILARAADEVWIESEDQLWDPSSQPETSRPATVVAHLDGDRWTTYDGRDDPTKPLGSLVEGADGSIWVTRHVEEGPRQLVRLDAVDSAVVFAPAWDWSELLSVAADGSIWAVQSPESSPEVVGHYENQHWTFFGPAEGIDGSLVGRVSATNSGVFLGTDQGLIRFDGDRWTPVWLDPAAALRSAVDYDGYVAVSESEAWAADDRGLWHYLDGAWDGPIRPDVLEGQRAWRLAASDDGALWVVTGHTVAVFAEGRWTVALRDADVSADLRAIDVAPDGSAWVGGHDRLVHLIPTASGFESREVACAMPAFTLAVAIDGTVWVGGLGYAGRAGLAHLTDSGCEIIDLRSASTQERVVEVMSIVTDPAGGVVVQTAQDLADPTASADEPDQRTLESVVRLSAGGRTILGEQIGDWPFRRGIAIDRDGQVWWAREPQAGGLARYDGERWVQVFTGVGVSGGLMVSRDGLVWFTGPSGIQRLRPDASR